MRFTTRQLPPHVRPGQILVLVGPTASGKTVVSLALAALLDGEIISADSRQIYRFLDIGTAKPARAERRQVRHYFIDELTPDAEFNAGEFGRQARKVIDDLFERNKTPIVVGGSGLYVSSLIDGFFEGPGADKEFREILQHQVAQGRVDRLLEQLRKVDPVSAEEADPTKPRRIIRALEVYHATGVPLSRHHAEQKVQINFNPVLFGLEWDREVLYARINSRCEYMIREGLLQEVEELLKRGYMPHLNALNTVGYAEAFAYQSGRLSFDEMINLFKRNSRRYAKRQLTWFRRDKRIRWMKVSSEDDPGKVAEIIAQHYAQGSP